MSSIKATPVGHSVHSFQEYPTTPISRSRFNRSNALLTSMNSGYLVPIYCDEALPGDTLQLSVSTVSRLATQIVPFMDNVYMDVHFWCVPNRLIWEHWTAMNGEQPNPGDSTDYLVPTITSPSGGFAVGSIFDYFGIRPLTAGVEVSALPFRAYNICVNEWYRDENLQNRVPQVFGDTDSYSNYTLLKRGKRKDYFTSALPWPLKNGTGVNLPLGVSAPVKGDAFIYPYVYSEAGTAIPYFTLNSTAPQISTTGTAAPLSGEYATTSNTHFGNGHYIDVSGGDNQSNDYPLRWAGNAEGNVGLLAHTADTANAFMSINNKTPLYADLSSATSATINSLRQAFAIQRMLEKDARGGTRYIEQILSHFGVQSPDARLQRPEFLGGATFNLNLNIVPQTSSTDSNSPQGNLSSFGVINGKSREIVRSFTEHCTILGIASIRADYTYQQGTDRMWFRRSRTDFYLPVLANLGEQAILNQEIFTQGSSVVDSSNVVVDKKVFGYSERWAEYRYKQNHITGQLRSDATLSLDYWHLAQDFSQLPVLNSEFITENPPISRVIAVSGENTPEFICSFYFKEYWTRPMPVYSIPSMADHF